MNISKSVNTQAGSTLIEAMIAIVILTVGILVAMSMQIRAIGASSSALHRTDANLVANSLLETLKQLDFNDPNLAQTIASPGLLVQGDANNRTFTAAAFPQMQSLLKLPAGGVAGSIIDQAGITYRLSWGVQDTTLTTGETPNKTIRVYMDWDSLMGLNRLEMTTIKHNNISL